MPMEKCNNMLHVICAGKHDEELIGHITRKPYKIASMSTNQRCRSDKLAKIILKFITIEIRSEKCSKNPIERRKLACPKPTVDKCILIGCRLVNTYGELRFSSIHLPLIVLFQNNSLGKQI